MAELPAGVSSGHRTVYRRHRPEDTLLYQIVSQHYPAFAKMMSAQGRPLSGFVQREFEDDLKWGLQLHVGDQFYDEFLEHSVHLQRAGEPGEIASIVFLCPTRPAMSPAPR